MEIQLHVVTEAEMERLGACLAPVARNNAFVAYLHGPLGAGKTTFVRGMLHALGYAGAVRSPTYTLVEPYQLNQLSLYHFDLYRLNAPEELEFIGFRDHIDAGAVVLIEWPEKGGLVPDMADMIVNIDYAGTERVVRIMTGVGEILEAFQQYVTSDLSLHQNISK